MRVNWSTFDKGKSATNHPHYWFLIIVHIIFTCFIYCLKLNFSTYLWCSIWISLDDLSFCLFKRSFIFPSLIYRLKFAKKKKRNIYIVQTAISHNIELYIANKKKKKTLYSDISKFQSLTSGTWCIIVPGGNFFSSFEFFLFRKVECGK